MARQFWMHSTGSTKVALTGGVAKTILSLTTPAAGVRIAIQAITVSFDGTSNTAQPVVCALQRITTDGTGTAQNPVKKDTDIATALLVTGKVNYSVEPTTYTAGAFMLSELIHPQAGAQYPLPLPGEIIVPGNAIIGFFINAPANVNCLAMIEGEE
jgi:hypothetical protein